MEQLLQTLENMTELDLSYKDDICNSLANNSYREALNAVFLDKKAIIRDHLDHSINYMPATQRMSEILDESLASANLSFTEEEVKDDELMRLEQSYRTDIDNIQTNLLNTVENIDQQCSSAANQVQVLLESQMRWRPIDEVDLNRARQNIVIWHDEAKNNVRREVTTRVLIRRNKLAEQRKRRRNFGKKATETLQNYFDAHKDHPYPNDEEKAKLAAECNISVQQVANWFGNRRIRSKKSQSKCLHENVDEYSNEGMLPAQSSEFSSVYGSSMNHVNYV